jgi:sulfatase maturation enzyme AslB (radical SAM superfamily)
MSRRNDGHGSLVSPAASLIMSRLNIRHLDSSGVIVNYNCVSSCGHCFYNCSPGRPKEFLDESTAGRIFERIAALGCRSVHIGGGEPLLQPQKLIDVSAAARQAGMGIDCRRENTRFSSTWPIEAFVDYSRWSTDYTAIHRNERPT